MEESRKKSQTKRKFSDNILVLYFLSVLLIILGQFLGMLLGIFPFMTDTEAAVTAAMYLSFIGIWTLTLLYLRFTKKNRPILQAVGRNATGNNWKNLLLGTALGFGLNGICILAAWLNKDISL